MGSKSTLVILAMGLGTIVALGLLTKLAVDSNPDLRSMVRFKTAFARDFEGRGIEEVSLRRRPGRAGYEIRIRHEARPREEGALARLDTDVAEYFVSAFASSTGSSLAILHEPPATAGCRSAEPLAREEVALGPVRERVEDRKAAARLAEILPAKAGCRLRSLLREGKDMAADVEAPAEFDGDAAALARDASAAIRAELGSRPYSGLIIRVHGGPGPGQETLLLEVRHDRRGRERGI